MKAIKQLAVAICVMTACGMLYAQTAPQVIVESKSTAAVAKTFNQGVKMYQNGNNTGAMAKFDECISQKRSFLESFLAKGYLLLCDKQYEEALTYFDTYKRKGGASAVVNECIADAQIGLGDEGAAIEAMNDAIAGNPNDVRLLRKRASMYIAAGRYDGAEQDLTKAIEQDKENQNLYMERAAARKLNNNLQGAYDDYTTLIEKDEKNPLYYSSRGVVSGEMGNGDDAIADFGKAIEINPSYYPAYINRAVVNINREEWEAAEDDLKYVVKKDNNNALAYNNLGILYFKMDKIEESIKYYDKAISCKSNYGYAYFNRGISKSRIDRDAAMEDWNKAVSYGVVEAARYIHTR